MLNITFEVTIDLKLRRKTIFTKEEFRTSLIESILSENFWYKKLMFIEYLIQLSSKLDFETISALVIIIIVFLVKISLLKLKLQVRRLQIENNGRKHEKMGR